MLRKRSRGVTSPQAIIDDHTNNPWLKHEKSTKPCSFFLNSPKFFKGFFSNSSTLSPSNATVNDPPIMSPTSILDTKAFSAFANSFWIVDNTNKNSKTLSSSTQHSWEQPNTTKGIGLALIDENNITESNNIDNDDDNNNNSNTISSTTKQQRRKLVVFGSQLRIQVPPMPQPSVFPCFSPDSPREFGIKTPKNNLWRFGNKDSQVHPQNMSPTENRVIVSEKGNEKSISLSDMELSEDYTCVKHNGPNPKTTHIFGNCIVESCYGVVGSTISAKGNGCLSNFEKSFSSNQSFLSFCHHCKKKLCEGSDIYMYRGEKAFCSQECRCQEMLFDGLD